MQGSTTTRIEDQTMTEAVRRITELPGVEETSASDVWTVFKCEDDTQFCGAVEAAMKARGVVLHKAERQDGFVSVVLEEYKDEI